ncbi:prolipoprotein diacylglyceryl transferase [Flavobacteriaceae bacterium]|jgi:phosphatidylglycerol:prolipoprotein diacylglycerol transferase|nr:prolipoprotein diacylglyceryl transferase [Flavobacteriaceae bacterium]MBT5392754.1 prolipoprotein diacylglyceryl transferase [Flavobacteriaceae bacterium]MBT7575178.1 prolipoprotein diacylglyceryl transferase [Flavobacteriaceae bacterium]MBT7984197.1 prolipoprotein diacylglyceryl transferase [Flavobacteriaceae bacterium]MDA7731606.1 prolipoprotein diacylglyceryl transferase [Flavobacteriaceae bacterium]
MMIFKINWAPNEVFLNLGPLTIYWYSVMFIIAFSLGYYIVQKIYVNDSKPIELVEPLFIYVVFGTLLGARLGEVFFYNWEYFQNNLIEILLPIKKDIDSSMLFGIIDGYKFVGYRGLASHGAAVGIITAMFIYKYKFKYDSVLWIFDRIAIPIAIGGMFVRIGNFFNSEIVGNYTNSNFGVVFQNNGEIFPRHPAQLYEAFGYLLLFILLWNIYWKTDLKKHKGFIFGLFLTCLFSIRILVENVKESQGGDLENTLGLLSTGQWLSIPFVIIGIGLMLYSKRKYA